MQFRDLKTQYQVLKEDIDKAMKKVAEDCNFISGAQVGALEDELCEYVGVKHCITCANGTDALSMAMMAWNIGKGDAVFVPDFTFFSSGEIVSHCGATPVFVDVSPDTFNISPDSLEEAIEKVLSEGKLIPKVIVAVDLFGLPADFTKLREIAEKHNLLILEDGAQGFGGKIGDRRACSFGDISTTSFFPAKPLGCYGDGGAVFTDDDDLAQLLRSIRVHGKGTMKYDNVRIGLNSRLDTIQAAILSIKLKAFHKEVKDVNEVADLYNKNIEKYDLANKVKIPHIPEGFYSSWAQYTLVTQSEEERNGIQSHLKNAGIPSMVYYPKPMHMQEAFKEKQFISCDVTESLCKTVISLPMHPYLSEDDNEQVVKAVADYFRTR